MNPYNMGRGQAEGLTWASRVMGIGFELASLIFLGWFLDRTWGTKPWLTVAGMILGIIASATHLAAILKIAGQTPTPRLENKRHVPFEDEDEEREPASEDDSR